MIATILRALAVLTVLASAPAAAVVFETVFPDPGAFGIDERERIAAHVTHAGQAWVQSIVVASPSVVITVEVHRSQVPTATGRSLWTAYLGNVAGRDLWQQGMAHELHTGEDLNGTAADVEFALGEAYLRDTLWLPADPANAAVPDDRVDALSVFLHEFGHALAYNGWADGTGTAMAAYASPWDQWLLAGDPDTGSPPLFVGPEAGNAWGSAPDVTLYNPSHLGNAEPPKRGARVVQRVARLAIDPASGSPRPPQGCSGMGSVPAPATALAGKLLPVSGLLAQLMNGVAFYRGHRYSISSLDLGVLRDVGLDVLELRVHRDGFEAAGAPGA